MLNFLGLVRLTGEAIWPLYVVAGAVVIGVAWYRRQRAVATSAPLWLLVAALVAPLALTVWASVTYGVERDPRPGQWSWASSVLAGLALGVVALLAWVQWRWRAAWLPALCCVVVALVATAAAWFVGAMAIADDWL